MGRTHSLLAAFAFIVASCGVQPQEAEQLGQSEAALETTGWHATTKPMPEQRRYHSATVLPSDNVLASDKVLVVGGWSYNSRVAEARLYDPDADPALGPWLPAGKLALAREAHTATRLHSGKVLVVGGVASSGYTNTAELYDPATHIWSPAGTTSQARGYNTATLLLSNKVLVVGGLSNGAQRTVDLYDPDAAPGSNPWSPATPLLEPRRSHTAVRLRLAPGKVLVAGGWAGGALKTTELYDPTTDTCTAGTCTAGKWTRGATSMQTARYGHTATELPDGKILVVGGQTASAPGTVEYTATAELYDPDTDTWTPAGTLKSARGYHTATLVAGKVLIAGGKGTGNVTLSSVEVYDPSVEDPSTRWSLTNPMLGARSDHAAVYSHTLGKVLVLGGSNNSALATAELYAACGLITCNTPPKCYTAPGTCSNATCDYTTPSSAGTACDDGNPSTTGDTCDGAGVCTGCGDGVKNGTEACDDGNTVTESSCPYGQASCTTCDATCTTALNLTGAYCGDSVKNGSETCDDGNTVTESSCPYGQASCTTCNATCTASLNLTGAYCGDSVKNGSEICDDGNATSETSCPYAQMSCTTCNATCTASLNLTGPYCGDATKNSSETCDDGNTATETSCAYGTRSCTACNATCSTALNLTGPYCGDATKNGAEACDDGNTTSETACPYGTRNCTTCNATCTATLPLTGTYCGDGVRNGSEACDDGNTTSETSCPYGQASCSTCNSTCTQTLYPPGAYCGDGVRNGPEACDDGNTTTEQYCPAGQATCTACNAACTQTLYLQEYVPPYEPSDCSSTTVSWSQWQPSWNGNPSTQGTYTCSGTVPAASHGASGWATTPNNPNHTGWAQYTCDDGTWVAKPGFASCDGKISNTIQAIECSSSDFPRSMFIGFYVDNLKRCADTDGLNWWVSVFKSEGNCKFQNGFYWHLHDGVSDQYAYQDNCWRADFLNAAKKAGEYPTSNITSTAERNQCGSQGAAPWTNLTATGPLGIANGMTCKLRP